ncbi:MAG: lysylphosphatidylglycerol synthase transmembrane domain-containing protein [Romboutsia sp.]|uniref:lysylphosphatidylglycerol synthase transmembrane domain-containing protein n=1 Tax=Romboutsia sp. TaxID=1965302 RepID=UPI003F3BFEE4
MTKLTKKKKAFIQYGFLLFLICLTTYLVSTTLDITLIPHIIKIVNKKFIMLGIILMIVYILFESLILGIIINSIQETKINFIGFKIATMGLYYNLVTPFASGSQPIQVYSLTQYNVSLSKSIAIITNKTVLFQTIVTIYCGYFIGCNLELLKTEMTSVMIMMIAGMCMNIFMIFTGMLIVCSPKKIKLIVNFIINLISKFKLFKNIKYKKSLINMYIDEYSYSIRIFIKDKKALFSSIILTIIQLTVFFSIAYCVYKAFNLTGQSYLNILTLQVFLYMAVSPVPTPGNVGANEIVFLTIFSSVFPKEITGYAVFLYGGFIYYFMVITCGLITVNTHCHMGKYKNKKQLKLSKIK